MSTSAEASGSPARWWRWARDRLRGRRQHWPVELAAEDRRILEHVMDRELTMVGGQRLATTLMACRHVAEAGIEGDFVECGVWRGGNSIVAADVFRRLAPDRSTWLFDTFAGMTAPTEADVSITGETADAEFRRQQRGDHNGWCYASLAEVQGNFREAGLGQAPVRFLPGDVAVTLGEGRELPDRIAVLRLDTDWYESTRLELEVLYPRLSIGGVLIVDDYGHWGGARKAVDEYFATRPRPFLQYTDYTGRAGVRYR